MKRFENLDLENKLSNSEIESVVYLWYTKLTPIIFMNNSGQEIDEYIEMDEDFNDDEKVFERHNLSDIHIYYLVRYWYQNIYDDSKLYAGEDIELDDFCTYKLVQFHLELV
jgi:hypothetical protein